MALLDFARSTGMRIALTLFVFGVLWRLVSLLLLRTRRELSEPRRRSWTGLRLIVTRMWPRPQFGAAWLDVANSYVLHVGFALLLLFYAPHVLFFRNLLGGLVPVSLSERLSWPALPTGVISITAALTLAATLIALVQRLAHPVRRLLSNFDDYASLLLTALPIATGLMAFMHVGGIRYERLLALHLLTVEAFIAWFPWGKLTHAITVFASRGVTGLRLERRGAAL